MSIEVRLPVKLSNMKQLEVIWHNKPQDIHFDTHEYFNVYYIKQSNGFNGTTYKLNVKYKIVG